MQSSACTLSVKQDHPGRRSVFTALTPLRQLYLATDTEDGKSLKC